MLSSCRNTKFYLLFPLFLKAGKSKNELSLPMNTRVLLALRVKLWVLINPRLPLKEKLTLKPASLRVPFPLLLLRLTSGKGMKPQTLAPPKPANLLPKKLFPLKRGQLSTLMMTPLSARKFLPPFSFLHPIFCMCCFFILLLLIYSGDEEEDPPVDVTARTSMSRTLVISEARHDADETSPPQQDIRHPTPAASPRASSPKRARIELVKEPNLLTDSSTTPPMDDVSPPFIHVSNFFSTFDSSLFFAVQILLPMLISPPPFFLSTFDEGIYSSWYPIRRVP